MMHSLFMLDFNPRGIKARSILKSMGLLYCAQNPAHLTNTVTKFATISWGESMEQGLPFSYLFLSVLTFKSVKQCFLGNITKFGLVVSARWQVGRGFPT
jgi:hypothetical protein